MWKTLAKEEKRVKDIINDAKRRAQRRRAYYESRLGDPMQLLRISGTAVKLVQNAESFAFQEDPANLMPWSSNPAVKIDRFDGRALLDYVPVDTPAMMVASQKQERDEDGLGNELHFERYHDMIDKMRLDISEEQCLAENEEEWNELVARHHAMIGKQPIEKKPATNTTASFGFNYGTKIVGTNEDDHEATHTLGGTGSLVEREVSALEEENILDHLPRLTASERDRLDELAAPFGIRNYFQMLKVAKRDQESRVRQLKVTALNLERTMMGQKPLKQAEIDDILRGDGSDQDDRDPARDRQGRASRRHRRRRRRRHTSRSRSPLARGSRRDSPSYEPYGDASSSSRSGSESPPSSPQPVKEEFISEFEVGSGLHHGNDRFGADAGDDSSDADFSGNPYYDSEPISQSHAKPTATAAKPLQSAATASTSSTSSGAVVVPPAKKPSLSLAEKLRQRMRQGLDQSIRSNELKKQTKEREMELERARENDEMYASSILRGQFTSMAASVIAHAPTKQQQQQQQQDDVKTTTTTTTADNLKNRSKQRRAKSQSPDRQEGSSSSHSHAQQHDRAEDRHAHKRTRRESHSRDRRSRSRSRSRRRERSRRRRSTSRGRERRSDRHHGRHQSRSPSRHRDKRSRRRSTSRDGGEDRDRHRFSVDQRPQQQQQQQQAASEQDRRRRRQWSRSRSRSLSRTRGRSRSRSHSRSRSRSRRERRWPRRTSRSRSRSPPPPAPPHRNARSFR